MAAFFFIGGGVDGNWNTVGNWSATSGGASNGATPSSTSDVTFDGLGVNGNKASSVSATQTVLSLTFTAGYTNSVTLGSQLTVAGNFTDNTAHSWAGAAAMVISATSTITSGGKTFPNNVSFTGGSTTKTLVGNWVIGGTLTLGSASITINFTTAETLSCAGLTMTTAPLAGTAKIILTGGTWSGVSAVLNNLDIAGNVTISGSVAFNTKTLTYVSGTVTTTGSTLTIAASTTLNTAGITWNNVTISATSTITINSLLSASGILTLAAAAASVTFAGSFGFTVGTLTDLHTSSNQITLAATVTYTITSAFNAITSRASGTQMTFLSSVGGGQAKIHLAWGATCNVMAGFTDIDASSGQPITTFNGTLSNTKGIISQTNAPPIYWNAPVQMRNLPETTLKRNRRFKITH